MQRKHSLKGLSGAFFHIKPILCVCGRCIICISTLVITNDGYISSCVMYIKLCDGLWQCYSSRLCLTIKVMALLMPLCAASPWSLQLNVYMSSQQRFVHPLMQVNNFGSHICFRSKLTRSMCGLLFEICLTRAGHQALD